MEASEPASAPVLSTPDTRIFEDQTPEATNTPRLSDEQVYITYEIERCVEEIREGRWKRIALQFPDRMLVDAPRVFQYLSRGLKDARRRKRRSQPAQASGDADTEKIAEQLQNIDLSETKPEELEKLFVLADTSYGACCVDEVAAEHASADVVVHYGRSCLSPTARLPVVYVFTKPPLDLETVYQNFRGTYPDRSEKIVLMADIPYHDYLAILARRLKGSGYTSVFVTSIVHDTASPLPNRTIPLEVKSGDVPLTDYSLFHVAQPPASLLLAVSSRVKAIHICPALSKLDPASTSSGQALPTAMTSKVLRRRYALLTKLTTAPVIGILVNTLSVASYMDMLKHLKALIASAGKKSYTFVVGKVNAAKIANFAEVGGWVVVGCWESSLFDSAEFWKPVVTPWELELALKQDAERVWTGDWRSDFGAVLGRDSESQVDGTVSARNGAANDAEPVETQPGDLDDEDESAPPEFDLRTGRYVSHSRPMTPAPNRTLNPGKQNNSIAQSLIKRANGDLATIGGEISPAAEFFKSKRTWQGLGSDYSVEYEEDGRLKEQEPAKMEIGRSGIARGYVVGDGDNKT